ncbi:hypothetical protein WH47_07640 [Habropoda laboriosa]|uniref:Mos1 transposase HTH domain-containing protein n=1 Tax=Habropoda laboriosa TaxID=597456 RepID=A0A0L7RED7_9HYME|nr:hypothetical protein WH47_07640 [Habropoda laboriosa]
MNNRDIRVIFLHKLQLEETADNINSAFEEAYVNVRTLGRWVQKFEIGDFSLESEPRGRSGSAVDEVSPHPPLFTNPFPNRPAFLRTPEQFFNK